jgi:hypothetical protein
VKSSTLIRPDFATLDKDHACAVIRALGKKLWRVSVEEVKKQRTNLQNKTIWGLAYETILRDGGESLQGWDKDDLHTFFLGEWSGWEVVEVFGKKRQRPIKRSSKLTRAEFADYFDFIQRKAAEFGIFIPDPDPHWND